MKEWDHLPNAHLIDRVLASLKENPDQWKNYETSEDSTWPVAWAKAFNSGRTNSWLTVMDAMLESYNMVGHVWDGPRNALAAFIAYDDAAKYLDMTSSELEVWAALSQDPAAVLLIPAVRLFEAIKAANPTEHYAENN